MTQIKGFTYTDQSYVVRTIIEDYCKKTSFTEEDEEKIIDSLWNEKRLYINGFHIFHDKPVKDYTGIELFISILTQIQGLEELHVRNVSLTTLPEKISDLRNLKTLDLSGTELINVPESIGDLESLQNLDLSGTNLSNLPESIGGLKNLHVLKLYGTKLKSLPERIGELENLQRLALYGTKLTSLPKTIGNLKNLQSLDVSSTQFVNLPDSICNLVNLENFGLQATHLISLPNRIGDLRSLKRLHLQGTNLTSLPDSLGDLKFLQRLDVSGTKLDSLPGTIGELKNLQQLDLHGTNLLTLPDSIGNLENLESLLLYGTKIISLPETIGNLTTLQDLSLARTELKTLPESIGELRSLQKLDLSRTPLRKLPDGIGKLINLQMLDLNETKLTSLPEDIGNIKELRNLLLSNTPLTNLPDSIGELDNLQGLDVSDTQLTSLPDSIKKLVNLKGFTLHKTKLNSLPDEVCALTNLQNISLFSTQITKLPERIGNLANLQRLDLSHTKLTSLPDSIVNLKKLLFMDLSFTKLQELPREINDLSSLKGIDISHCILKEIPEHLLSSGTKFVQEDNRNGRFYRHARWENESGERLINIYETILQTQPISLFTKEPRFIKQYFDEKKIAVNSTKVIILGQGGAGKTYTLARLINNGKKENYKTDMTQGVDIKEYTAVKDGRQFVINFWDFGGQEMMHSMHRCFLTERTCYLIVVDSRRSDMDMMAQARYWLNNIASFAPHSPVIVMANMWDDDVYRGDLDEGRLHREFDDFLNIREFIHISSKNALQKDFLSEFVHKVIDVTGSMVSLDMQFPLDWNEIRKEIQNLGKNKINYYISQREYYEICEKHGLTDRDIQIWLLDWFNDLGECFSYYKVGDEDNNVDYKVLNPQWITNAIYILITRGYKKVDQKRSPGVLNMASIRELLKKAEGGVVDYIKEYKSEDCQYIIKVMQKFELAYSVSAENEFIFVPALLPKSEPKNVRPVKYKQRLRYEMRYRFLPLNLLQKLMVRYYGELELNSCWDKGMVLKNEALGQYVVLDMGGGDDILRIEAYAQGQYPCSTMLNLVLERLDNVNSSLLLKPEQYIVIDSGIVSGNDIEKREEKPVEVNKLLNLKKRGHTKYQGDWDDYLIDELLGNTFGSAAQYAEQEIAESGMDTLTVEDYLALIYEALKDDIPRTIIDQNKIIESLVRYINENSIILNDVIQKIENTNKDVAEDLRKINKQMENAHTEKKKEEAKQKLAKYLSNSGNLATILSTILATSTNPMVIGTVQNLLSMI